MADYWFNLRYLNATYKTFDFNAIASQLNQYQRADSLWTFKDATNQHLCAF